MNKNNSARLYHNCINEQGHSNNVRESSDIHNLRNAPNMENVINNKTKNNILYINGQKVDPLDTENNFNLVQQTCNNLKKTFQDEARKNDQDVTLSAQRKAELQQDRTKLKHKIKKWSENPKAEQDEKEFFKKLYDNLGNEKLNSEDLITELQGFGKSVKRFNDKRKAISGVDGLNELVGTSSMNINLSLITKEVVYKIPEQWEKEVSAKDFLKITRAINKKFYPDFDPIYETIHNDEQSPHAHIRLSGLNNKTNKFDMQNSLLNRVRAFDKENRLPKDKKYSQLNKEETQLFGEIYQEQVFYLFNKHLKTLKYDFEVVKRTQEEKKDDFKKFKDKKCKIADREYNLQNHLAEKNEVAKEELNNTNEKVLSNNEMIEIQNNVINDKKETIEELKKEQTYWEKLTVSTENAFKAAFEYAKNKLMPDLKWFKQEQDFLNSLNKEVGEAVNKQSVEMQPTTEQKNNIRDQNKPRLRM